MRRGWKKANLAKCVMLASGAEAEDIRYMVHHTTMGATNRNSKIRGQEYNLKLKFEQK